jgi:hypothetical protein
MLFRIANLNWISVVLLAMTLIIMTMQFARVNGGHLPQHAPKVLPPGVLGLDGWADRLIVLSNCAWVFLAAWHAIKLRHKHVQWAPRYFPVVFHLAEISQSSELVESEGVCKHRGEPTWIRVYFPPTVSR